MNAKTINPKIQANERITFLKDLPEAVELKEYIDKLDKKYNVDSTDPDNTFGMIFIDQPIIKHGANNTLYFAGISVYSDPCKRLPKYQKIPPRNTQIGIDSLGHTILLESQKHHNAKKIPLTIEESDIERLMELRVKFKDAVMKNDPKTPDYSKIVNKNNASECNKVLIEQGFATKEFSKKLLVKDKNDLPSKFVIRYERCGNNYAPHFSTTYKGWQNQEEMSKDTLAYQFYKKWDIFHLTELTQEEYDELMKDLEILGAK